MKILGIHHVSLLVADTATSVRFYTEVIGLDTDDHRPDLGFPGAWLWVNDAQQIHLLELPNPDPVSGRADHGGRDRHVAFHIQGLDAVKENLDRRSIPYTLSRSGRKALFCRDPDGNGLELIECTGV